MSVDKSNTRMIVACGAAVVVFWRLVDALNTEVAVMAAKMLLGAH